MQDQSSYTPCPASSPELPESEQTDHNDSVICYPADSVDRLSGMYVAGRPDWAGPDAAQIEHERETYHTLTGPWSLVRCYVDAGWELEADTAPSGNYVLSVYREGVFILRVTPEMISGRKIRQQSWPTAEAAIRAGRRWLEAR